MVKKINLAVVGSGYWGSKLTSEYIQIHEENPDFNFMGVIDNDKKKLDSIKDKYQLDSSMLFSNVSQCLADPTINAIHIATPMETHYDLACEAISERKHILLEKPMAMNARDAFKIARLAEKNGNVVLVGHIFRFNAALVRAKELLDRNAIGTVKSLTFSWLDFLNPIPERDIIFDLVPHPVDILNYLIDDWPSSVFALTNRKNEDSAFVLLEMPDHKPVQISVSWFHSGPQERIVIIAGSDGRMTIDTISQQVSIYMRTGKENIPVTKNNTMRSMMDHFINCVDGSSTPNNSSLVGAMTVNVISAARNSLREGRMIKVFD